MEGPALELPVTAAPAPLLSLALLLAACSPGAEDSAAADPCQGDGATADCLSPTQDPAYYAEMSDFYFDTMDKRVELTDWPPYSERVARWEWPPWLKLTAYTRENIEATDILLRLYPSIVEERDCRAFDQQPFGRCRVVFYYDYHNGLGCPIYEEFTFNDAGEITWIEAWSDLPGLLPMDDAADPWAEGSGVTRLSTRIPGLGRSDGFIDPAGPEMQAAAATDADVADFAARALDWSATWAAEADAAGEDLWARGCGW